MRAITNSNCNCERLELSDDRIGIEDSRHRTRPARPYKCKLPTCVDYRPSRELEG